MNIDLDVQLTKPQKYVWDSFVRLDSPLVRCVINTGRQVGKTTLGKLAVLYWALESKKCEIGYLTPENKHFLKVLEWFKHMPKDIVKRVDSIRNVVYFNNGSTLYFYSVDNYEAIRGQTFHFRIMDEFAFGRFGQQEAIAAYDPTFGVNGIKDLILSTPKGKNQHYKAFQRAQGQPDEMSYYLTTEQAGIYPQDKIEKSRQELPAEMFQQEYEGRFISSGGEVFSNIDANAIVSDWEHPNPMMRYVAGIDWASKSDKSVLHIINIDTGETSSITTIYGTNYPTIIKEFVEDLELWNVVGLYAETNGVGQATFDYLVQAFPKADPFNMSQSSKEELVTLTRSYLQQGDIKIPTQALYPDLFNQLSDYTMRISDNGRFSYSHPKGGKDDEVDAFMMACKAYRDFKYGGQKILGRNNSNRRRRH